jgi:diguanylate cyclase (GGDEF)-like protein
MRRQVSRSTKRRLAAKCADTAASSLSALHDVDSAEVFAKAAAIRNSASEREQLERLNQWLEVALNNMARGLSMFDAEQRLLLCNKVYRQIYNLPEELTRPGTPLAEIVRFHVKQETGRDDEEEIKAQKTWIAQHVAELAKGQSFAHTQHLSDGRTILVTNQPLADGSWVDLQEDITERRHAEQKISWLARHDTLTEIPNRFHFHEQLDCVLQHLDRGEGLAVHWIDLDRFKDINDALGHPVGDALLKSIGGRLFRQIREPDFVGRLGGDEFAIVQSRVTKPEQAVAFVKRILALFEETHQLMGHQVDIGASIGIALAPEHGTTADELLKNADIALYQAKSLGRGTFAIFDPAFSYQKQNRRQLELDLRVALAENQLELFYQPIRDVKRRRITSCEALMRWRHPKFGLIPPCDFIPLAEETGLILPMGSWALREACKAAAVWPRHVGVTVNLSAVQFTGCDLYETVKDALRLSGLSADRLELEITESVLLRDDAQIVTTLHKLRACGVRIALDDFGTAFASLSYLRSFPFDTIKIDRSFVRDLPQNTDCAATMESITGLARKLRMSSVVEGVETAGQLECAMYAGCDEVQGYYFNRPVPLTEIADVLAREKPYKPGKRIRRKSGGAGVQS